MGCPGGKRLVFIKMSIIKEFTGIIGVLVLASIIFIFKLIDKYTFNSRVLKAVQETTGLQEQTFDLKRKLKDLEDYLGIEYVTMAERKFYNKRNAKITTKRTAKKVSEKEFY